MCHAQSRKVVPITEAELQAECRRGASRSSRRSHPHPYLSLGTRAPNQLTFSFKLPGLNPPLVGSSTGAVARRLLLGLYPRFPSSCPFRSCRSSVSSARRIARSVRISRTTRTCTVHGKVYGTYQTGTTAPSNGQRLTRYSEKSPKVSYSHFLLHRFQPKPRR